MIKFHCSKCNIKIAVPDDSVGKKCQCPKCKTIARVPDTSSSTEMPVGDNSSQKDAVQISCPKCGKQYRVATKNLNKKLTCQECGSELSNNDNDTKLTSENTNLIHFKCSQCKQELEAPEIMRGKTILCHHCQSSVTVEMTEHQPEASEEEESIQFRLKKETKDCPYCGEEILEVAKKCKHCGEFLDTSELSESGKEQDSPQNRRQEASINQGVAPLMGFFLGLLLVNFIYPLGLSWLCNYEDQIESGNTYTWCLVGQIIDSFAEAEEYDDSGCAPCASFNRLSSLGGIMILLFGGFVGMGIGSAFSKGGDNGS